MKLPVAVVLLVGSFGLEAELGAQEWIKFETIDQSALPIVRSRLNGMGPHRLVIDVSFKELALDTLIVEGSGMELLSRGEEEEIEYYGRKETVPVRYLQTLQLGGATFQLVRTLLIDGEDATGMGGLRSYGRIGRDVLETLRLTVHYPQRLLLLEPSPSEVPPGGVTYTSAGRFLLIPVRLEREGEGVTEDVDVEVNLVLDAGTSNTVLDRRWAADAGFAKKKASQTVIPKFSVGAFSTEGLPVLLGEMHELPYDGKPVGVIGADLLNRISVSYDFARDLVWLKRVEKDAS
jgi:hypothetical protein